MTLPDNFNEAEHLQDLFRRYANRQVRDFFRDLGGDDWDPDISTTRGSLRYGCEHKDADSLPMTLLRWELFSYVRKHKFEIPFIGIPVTESDEIMRYRPQIVLFFMEDLADVDPGFSPVSGRISFRLMNHDSSSFTPAVAQTFATRIRSEFAAGGGYVWRKGRIMMTYNDTMKGYRFQVVARDENYGRTLISKVLDLQNDTLDDSLLQVKENKNEAAAFPIIPPNDLIYGESRRTPRKRPLADVRFQYAVAHVHGLKNRIPLVDRTGLYDSALEVA